MDVGHCLLDGNADAVEFCPHNSFQHVLAASTYTLQEGEKPARAGSISLFEVDARMGQLELAYKTETAGIFDIKWNPKESNLGPLLAQGDADGYVRIHKLKNCSGETESSGYSLKEMCSESISSSMCLCLDWSSSSTSIIVGLSDGSVSLLSFNGSQVTSLQEWKAHDFEVWATSFDTNQPHLVYTGSDDCKFSCYDVRADPSNSVFHNTKTHKMGVCCISKSPYDDNTVLTGSYDENLRVWDVRSVSKPLNECSIHLGGGVWRIKHHPSIPGLVLTACMHNGFAIVRYDYNGEGEVIEKYDKHGSLAYGADWQRGKPYSEGVVATCSFYDKLVRGTNNLLELVEKMNTRVAEEYTGYGDLASGLRVFMDQLKSKAGSFDEYVQQIDSIEHQVTEFEAVISMLDKYVSLLESKVQSVYPKPPNPPL